MREALRNLSKAAVTGLIKPDDLAVQVGHKAIDQVFAWLPAQKSKRDALIARVAEELEQFADVELKGRDELDAAIGNATVLFETFGLSASEFVDLNLKPAKATEALLARGGHVLANDQAVAGLCRDRIVPRVHELLLEDPQTISDFSPAITQALLSHREAIEKIPDEVGQALRRMLGQHLVVDPSERWQPDLPDIYLLRAEYGVVPFHARRRPEVQRLLDWCEAEALFAVRVMTGAGGTGKTRLMVELCRQARLKGWRAGFLHRETPVTPSWELDGLVGGERPLLLVVDYAETKREVLVPVLRRLIVDRGRSTVRVILVARALSDWWRELQRADPKLQERLDERMVAVEPLAPIALPQEARIEVLEAAAKAFARQLPEKDTQHKEPDASTLDLSAPHFANALFLHIGALAAVVGDPAKAEEALLHFVLSREERHWQDGLASASLTSDLGVDEVAQALALVTLVSGADDKPAARSLLQRAPMIAGFAPPKRDRLIDLLHRLYPGEAFLEPLRPDLVGEHLVDRALDDDPSLLNAAIGEEASEEQIRNALTVLTRLAKQRGEARRWLARAFENEAERLAEPAIQVAIETGDPIGQSLAEALYRHGLNDPQHLQRLIPWETVALREVATAVLEQMLAAIRAVPSPWSEQVTAEAAGVAGTLVKRLSDLGRREDALNAAQKARDLFHTLAADRPDAFAPDLATSLHNLAVTLRDLGRSEDALNAGEGALALRRELAADRPDVFTPYLASSLDNVANMLSDLGRREDALNAAQEARDLFRTLAADRPDAFNPDLAMSLNNLASKLLFLGRGEDALNAAQEAVVLHRQLAADRPDGFTHKLALSLITLATTLSERGRREDALNAAQEARDLFRTLAADRPDAFNPDLAMSLNNLASKLLFLGRREDALNAAQEAVALRRQLAADRPDAFNPDLAMSLNDLAAVLYDLGGREDALNNLATMLSELGRREDALNAAQEAVALHRQLAADRPDAFTPDLAMSLNNLAVMLSLPGRREHALNAAQEAVVLRRQLAAGRPDVFNPDLAASLNNLATTLSKLGRREDALNAAQEAVALRRQLAADRPDAFTPDLAISLWVLALCLDAMDDLAGAVERNREAIETSRPYFLAQPQAFIRSMVPMRELYLALCEKLGREPDQELLAPIAEVLQRVQEPES